MRLLLAAFSLLASLSHADVIIKPPANPAGSVNTTQPSTWTATQTFLNPANVYYGDASHLTGVPTSTGALTQLTAVAASTTAIAASVSAETSARIAADASIGASTAALKIGRAHV